MTIFAKPPRYRSYLLTLWEEQSHDPSVPAVWRLSLQDPRTGKRRGFGSLEALAAALAQESRVVDGRLRNYYTITDQGQAAAGQGVRCLGKRCCSSSNSRLDPHTPPGSVERG